MLTVRKPSKRRTAAVSAVAIGALSVTALVAGPLSATAKKPIAILSTKSAKCKKGYEKATLTSGKGKKKETVYVCVLEVTKTVTKIKTVTKDVPEPSSYVAANNTIVGSGSNTAYSVLASLSSLFNSLQGCDPIYSSGQAPSGQPLDFSCPSGTLSAIAATDTASLNPLNDVAVEEPAIGGSAGVSQLELQGCDPDSTSTAAKPCSHLPGYVNSTDANVAKINFASTTSGPSTTNDEGLNFVAYAEDGLSWFHFTNVDGTPTPSAGLTDLSTADLQGIWNGTITNWDQITDEGTPPPSAPIDVYTASAGAGVRSVWEKFLGESSGGSSTYIESKGTAYANTHIIPQNEDQDIIANGDENDAIFFFSVGKFGVLCGDGTAAACTDGKSGTQAAIGSINGVAPTAANIYGKTFLPTLKLYTVYSNGTNPYIAPATQATLNFASEDGWLCRPDTTLIDPNTGLSVRTEIDTAILKAGFLPLDKAPLNSSTGLADESQAIAPFAEGSVTNPGDVTASPYSEFDLSGANPTGYCTVSSTDGGVSTTQ